MQDKEFLQANKVFSGRLRDNKEKGLDVSKPRTSIEKEDMEKLFNEYFAFGMKNNNTEILLHKVFFDVVYYTGRRAKEGLRELNKSSFDIKIGADKKEYIQINFNEKTKKNQGNDTSTTANSLHNDRHIISALESDLCPVKSFKKYISLLNPVQEAFFQYPTKDKRYFTTMVVGKNTLGSMMSDISKKANLSCTYTNHQIRKTTATAVHRSGFDFKQIAHITKHKNLDSLKHYVDGPTHADKHEYNDALYRYGGDTSEPTTPKQNLHQKCSNPHQRRPQNWQMKQINMQLYQQCPRMTTPRKT